MTGNRFSETYIPLWATTSQKAQISRLFPFLYLTPVHKEALAQLSAAELKKIGVTLSEAGDQTVVRPVDSEVDKMVDALLKAATGEEGEA